MQKGFGVIYLLIGVVIITVLAGAAYLGKLPVQLPFSQSQVSVSPTPQAQEVDETVYTERTRSANWKTYTNSAYSFEYPSNWVLRAKSECIGPAVLPNGTIGTNNSWLVVCGPYSQGSAQELADMSCNAKSANKLLERNQVEVNGNKAIKQQCKEIGKSNNENYDVYRTSYYFTKKYADNLTSVIVIDIHNHEKINPSKYHNQFDRILSTFKFID